MPVYQITAPDGRKLRVTAPEGATQEDALAYAQQQLAQKPDLGNVQAKSQSTETASAGRNPFVNAADALQHHAGSALHGAAQFIEHGVNAAANLLPDGNPVRGYVNRTVAADDAAIAKREADYQARTPDGTSAFIGAAAGEILPWIVGVGELRAAGMLPKVTATGAKGVAQKGGLLAAEGATMGAAQPVTEGDYGRQKLAQVATGAVAAPAIRGVTKVVRSGVRYVTPSGRDAIANERLAKMFGSDPATIQRLQAQGSSIPGFRPTVAQALATPEAVQAERILRNRGETAPIFANREASNNAAIRAQVGKLAGTDADIAAARAARDAATKPYYSSLPGVMVDPAPILNSLDALAASSLGVRPNIKAAANSLRAEIQSRLGQDGKIDAGVLSGLRENAASFLGPMASAQEKRALGPVADSIADTLDRAVPGYRANLAAYASASQPITDMQAFRALADAIDSGGRDAAGNQAVALSYLKSLLAKDAKAKFKMSPQARAQAQAMLDALQKRSVTNNTIAATGPGTAADLLRGAAGSPVNQRLGGGILALIGNAFGGAPTGIMALLASEVGQAANRNVVRRVGEKAADSQAAAEALRAAQQQQLPGPLARYLLPYQP